MAVETQVPAQLLRLQQRLLSASALSRYFVLDPRLSPREPEASMLRFRHLSCIPIQTMPESDPDLWHKPGHEHRINGP